MQLRLLHFSDPHFSHVTWHPKQFFSKQWLGNLNLALFRRNLYSTAHLQTLPALASTLRASHIAITGDFTSTSQPIEFKHAQEFVAQFHQPVLTLPGNHDVYTHHAETAQLYYRYFPSSEMQTTGVACCRLAHKWWWIGLDCARAHSIWKSNGIFCSQTEQALIAALHKIPRDHMIVLANHFPLFPRGRPAHDTERADVLQALLRRHPNIKLYLHGHDHAPYIKEHSHMPLVLNPGSVAKLSNGSCYFLLCDSQGCLLRRYRHTPHLSWVIDLEKTFMW